jgi:hypothetical protein
MEKFKATNDGTFLVDGAPVMGHATSFFDEIPLR